MGANCLPSLITCMRLLGGWSRSPLWEVCARGGQRVEHQQDLGPALKEQKPRSPCGFPLLPHGLGDAASSPGLLAPSGAVLRLLLLLPGSYLSWFGLPTGDGRWQSCSCRKG